MKLSFFIHSLRGGGAERITSYMANYWADQGHEVAIITVADVSAEDYAIDKKITRIPLKLDMQSTTALSGLWNNITRISSLRKTLKQQRPDVLISMMPSANVTAAYASIGLPTKAIGAERIYPAHGQISRFWVLLRKYSYGFLDSVVVQTAAGASWIENNTNAKPVVVIHNHLELPIPRFNPEIEAVKVPGRNIILGVGRLVPQKQFDHLIKAFAKIYKNHASYDLVILGEGGERERLEKLVDSLGLIDRVRMPGRAGNVEDWFGISDLFVLSSAVEGFPNALLEAMAHGLPCVSYDCLSGPSDIISNSVDGSLVDSGDVGKLADQISLLLTDESLRSKFAFNTANKIKKFETQAIMKKWESTIKNLLGQNA